MPLQKLRRGIWGRSKLLVTNLEMSPQVSLALTEVETKGVVMEILRNWNSLFLCWWKKSKKISQPSLGKTSPKTKEETKNYSELIECKFPAFFFYLAFSFLVAGSNNMLLWVMTSLRLRKHDQGVILWFLQFRVPKIHVLSILCSTFESFQL